MSADVVELTHLQYISRMRKAKKLLKSEVRICACECGCQQFALWGDGSINCDSCNRRVHGCWGLDDPKVPA